MAAHDPSQSLNRQPQNPRVTSQSALPEIALLRLRHVLRIIPISRSAWYAGVKEGRYPAGFKIGRATVWKMEDIRVLVERIGTTRAA
jgi:predicted DNA-binding transcriptional regulator AlpA